MADAEAAEAAEVAGPGDALASGSSSVRSTLPTGKRATRPALRRAETPTIPGISGGGFSGNPQGKLAGTPFTSANLLRGTHNSPPTTDVNPWSLRQVATAFCTSSDDADIAGLTVIE